MYATMLATATMTIRTERFRLLLSGTDIKCEVTKNNNFIYRLEKRRKILTLSFSVCLAMLERMPVGLSV